MTNDQQHKRRWRDYRTASGARPVQEFLDQVPREDKAAILVTLGAIRRTGLTLARHLRGDIYEAKIDTVAHSYRVLFATEGCYNQVLLSLEAFSKKTRKTPPEKIQLAERRLADWRRRKG